MDGIERKVGGSSLVHEPFGAGTPSTASIDPGKLTLIEQLPVIQRSAGSDAPQGEAVQRAASQGVAGAGSSMPYHATIQQLFGRHDISGVQAHVGGAAATASRAIGAEAYATGNHVAFASAPSLHTAAHEAAHVVQQRGGVQLKGGVGEAGDRYEQHANAVADSVVRGATAEALLDQHAGGGAGSAVQRQAAAGGHSDEGAHAEPPAGGHSDEGAHAEPPAGSRSEQRGQVLAHLLEEWRAAGRLDAPARPRDVAAFPPIAPARTGAIRASGQAILASAAPALVPVPPPGLEPAPAPPRPTLKVIPGGKGLAVPPPAVAPTSMLIPALFGIATFLIVVLWPSETQPPWMEYKSPITGAPYGSPEEYEWTKRLSDAQVEYLRKLAHDKGAVAVEPHAGPDKHAAPTPAPAGRRVPILDGAEDNDDKLPPVNFYHGTDGGSATRMVGGEPVSAVGRGEFGKGFYTFLVETAAAEAAQVYTRNRNAGFMEWGVVDFAVPADVMAQFFAASSVAALLAGKLSRILVFPDKATRVTVRYPSELGGIDSDLTWAEFVDANARFGKATAWPYDLIIGPLKGKLRSEKNIHQWTFGDDGVMVFNVPKVSRRMVASGPI